jgi:2-iminoacetate synthase
VNRNEALRQLEQATSRDVERALTREHLDECDLLALLSEAAAPYIEPLAQRALELTRQRFGRTIQLYAPLYLSNECVNRCTYCGFSHELDIPRVTLNIDAVRGEAEHLHAQGFRHLLLVAGEAPKAVSLDYLVSVAQALRPRFDSLSIEVGTFKLAGYEQLVAAGYDGLTLYQETYQVETYRKVHLAGPKHDYARRLDAIEHGGLAGFRTLGIGALLGLAPWQLEAHAVATHGRMLALKHWRSRIAVSFPRIRDNAGGRLATHPVSDRALVQMICATRLFLPDAELVLSTREPSELRDHLVGIGITRMSAGSRTNPGGYLEERDSGEQFAIEDSRPASEVAESLVARGYEPVWKDFDRAFLTASEAP